MIREGVIDEDEGDLLFGEGYAKKRNTDLYFASKKGMDKLLFIDDDEDPLAVLRDRLIAAQLDPIQLQETGGL